MLGGRLLHSNSIVFQQFFVRELMSSGSLERHTVCIMLVLKFDVDMWLLEGWPSPANSLASTTLLVGRCVQFHAVSPACVSS